MIFPVVSVRLDRHDGWMTEVRLGGRRRLDRVLDPVFMADLATLSMAELRARRDDAAQEETDLSYLRRLLHARLDLVAAEQAHRGGLPGRTVDDLARVLGVGVTGAAHGSGRFLTVSPSRTGEHRRAGEALVSDPSLSDVTTLDDEELLGALAAYQHEEHQVSQLRHRVQVVMDTCNAEVGRRYSSGGASVDALLAAQCGSQAPWPPAAPAL